MKKYSLYTLLMLLTGTILFSSCKDDDNAGSADANRLFMPMFRHTVNTSSSTTEFYCDIASRVDQNIATYLEKKGEKVSTHVNDMRLFWYGVEGADAYQLKAKVQGTEWDRDEVLDVVIPADQLTFLHEDLQYGVGYLYAIRALVDRNDLNNPHNSKWYGYGDGSHQSDQSRDDNRNQTGALTTGMRYEVPSVFWPENVTKTGMDICFTTDAPSDYETAYKDFVEAGAQVQDGKWVFDEIRVTPSADNPTLEEIVHKLTPEEKLTGRIHVEGLTSNAAYIVTGQNNNVERYYDRQYNSTMVRMQGEPGEPIYLHWTETWKTDTILQNNGNQVGTVYGAENLKACRIDTILTNYMSDASIAEGQIFYLDGGKEYYCSSTVEITKGLTLATNPADIAAGKGRAIVYQGVGYNSANHAAANAVNWGLCRNARSGAENGVMLAIQPIIFEDINFRPQYWYNYFDQKATDKAQTTDGKDVTITANYFMNMYSQGLSFTLAELRCSRCTFSGHVRGFIRFQGPNRQIISNLTVEDCVFYDEGGYDTNGRGYSWFAGPGNNAKSNFYQNFKFVNNTIVNSPRHALVTENGNLAWPGMTKWNIEVSNNTFINFSPRSSSSGHGLIFETRYIPAGSTIICKKNLFVNVTNPNDKLRDFYNKGMRIDTKDLHYDFADNYSTTVPDWTSTSLADGFWTNYAFSNTKDGAGYQNGALNAGGLGETALKYGDDSNGNEPDAVGYKLSAEELFVNPTPLGTVDAKETFTRNCLRHNVDGFYFNNSDRVKNHPIFTKGIGDPRWRTGASWNGSPRSAASKRNKLSRYIAR